MSFRWSSELNRKAGRPDGRGDVMTKTPKLGPGSSGSSNTSASSSMMGNGLISTHKRKMDSTATVGIDKVLTESRHAANSISNPNGSNSAVNGPPAKKRRDYPWDQIAEPARNTFAKKPISTKPKPNPSVGANGDNSSLQLGKPPQKHILSDEQQRIQKAVVEDRKNVFFTGSAGTGKSVLLRVIIEDLKKKYKNRSEAVAITASTGLAAINIGGTTIHSFAGFGLGEGTVDSLIKKVKANRKASARWIKTEALVLDEVSMLDGDMFDKLNAIAQDIRKKKNEPFGGMQIIMTGDFFQLPPVNKRGNMKFAFEAKTWNSVLHHTYNLKKVFRQRDQSFVDMLNQMRYGTLSSDSIAQFRKLSRVPAYDDGLEPTELFPLRTEVENANQSRLNALKTESITYVSQDTASEPKDRNIKTLEHIMAPQSLTLKVGAQVMLIKNREDGLVNGSIGTVIGFGRNALNDDDVDGFIDDEIELDFKPKKSSSRPAEDLPPVVEFITPRGKFKTIVDRMEFKVEDNSKTIAKRVMIPLILAWSMSIHKSQGQTLERVKVDLRKIFEKGQAYVALSRCTSLEGLQVLGFDPSKVMAHPRVINWYKTLK